VAGSSGSGNPEGGAANGGSSSPSGGSGNQSNGGSGASDPTGGTATGGSGAEGGTGASSGSGATGGSGAEGGTGASSGSGAEGGTGAVAGSENGGSGGSSTPGGPNLVVNGDFAIDAYGWQFTEAVGATAAPVNGELCVALGSATSYGVLGYPTVGMLSLASGVTYEFSFSSWTDVASTLYLIAKVGDAEPPYTDYALAPISQTSSKTRFSTTFDLALDDETAGVAFVVEGFSAGQFCIDDVVVRELTVSAQRL
jgi:hypothetical protein